MLCTVRTFQQQIILCFEVWITFYEKKIFNSQLAVENAFLAFIGSPSQGFYAKEIDQLPLKWQKCMDDSRAYF